METVNLDFWVLIRQGAISTYPLLLCSVVVVGVTLERLWSLRGIIDSTKTLAASVVPLLDAKKRQEAQTLLAGHDACHARRVFSELLEASHKSIEHLDRIADERQFEEVQGAMSYLWSLGTIAAAAPFIGLFGTVIGIIRAFHAMAITGTGGFVVVAAGISEALIATALGLGVGISALVIYNYFQARVDRIDAALRIGSARLIDAIAVSGTGHGVQ